jgi:hypothetical protein
MATSPLLVKGCKNETDVRRSEPLSREGSLSCHTCCDTGFRVWASTEAPPYSFALYDAPGDDEDLFLTGPDSVVACYVTQGGW